MKIAILTSGLLPIPAVQGGAVENLTDFYLAYNHEHRLHDITVYSIANEAVQGHPALTSDVNHYEYFEVKTFMAKLDKKLTVLLHGEGYYFDTIQYYLYRAIWRMRKAHFDVIVVENRPGYIPTLRKMFPKARIVLHLHNDIVSVGMPEAHQLYADADRILTVSDFIAGRVRTLCANDTKCRTVYNGIDLHRFSPGQTANAKRRDYGLSDDDFVLVFLGRVIKEKGIRELIDTLNVLKDYPRIKLLVMGSSFYANARNDSMFISELKELAKQLPPDRLIFTGYVPYTDVPAMLSLADVAVLPSIWEEPLGLTCLEAMATGLPVITTIRGGIPETVSPDSGILLPVDDHLVDALAQSILQLYNHPEQRQQMGLAGQRAAARFSKEQYARNFFAALT